MKPESWCFKIWATDSASFNALCIVPQTHSQLPADPMHCLCCVIAAQQVSCSLPASPKSCQPGTACTTATYFPSEERKNLTPMWMALSTAGDFPVFLNVTFLSVLEVSSEHSPAALRTALTRRLRLSITLPLRVIPFSYSAQTFDYNIPSHYRMLYTH